MKNQKQVISEYVAKATPEELTETIQSLLHSAQAGIQGMKGEAWLSGCGKPESKKEAIRSALAYCEIVNSEIVKKIFGAG